MRFFEKIPNDIHNLRMATDRHQAPSYPLRMPDELKAKIQGAAEVSGRSLHAELLYRLNASFPHPLQVFHQQIEGQVLAIQTRIEMQHLRIDLLRTRMEGLLTKCRLISAEADGMLKAAQTDSDLAAYRAKTKEIGELEKEGALMAKEVEEILADREGSFAQLNSLTGVLADARQKIEAGMAEYMAGRAGA